MKKNLLLLIAAIFILTSCEYTPGVSEAFIKYRFKDGVFTLTVPGWVIRLASNSDGIDKNERELLESIDKVRILVVEDENLNGKINLHKEFASKIKSKNHYEELMTVNDNSENVVIYGKTEGDVITEMVLLVSGDDDNALIFVRGEISPDLINDMARNKNRGGLLSLK
jgi:hypothetical protein